eukprot:gene6393-biopygen4064
MDPTIPAHVHGVNTFCVPELKGRRRLITEPHLNGVIAKHEIPKVAYPTRLSRRQSLRYARYMIQIDFEAFYDSIPMPTDIRDNFVFRTKDWKYFRLCTLPTGARWSVAVGQAITNVIVDIDTPVTVHTLIDNIMIAAQQGQEAAFLSAVRRILQRIREANLLTSPGREELLSMPDEHLLRLAEKENTFLGEEYCEWNGRERMVRNSSKTVAKVVLSLRHEQYTNRAFASTVSLILFALHTTQINPATAFKLLRAYRGVYRQVTRGHDWDEPMIYLDPGVRKPTRARKRLVPQRLVDHRRYTSPDIRGYGVRLYLLHRCVSRGLGCSGATAVEKSGDHVPAKVDSKLPPRGCPHDSEEKPPLQRQYSAHAEPRAVHILLQQLVKEGLPDGAKVAVVTDHFPIAHAQKRLNGYGGIGRGYALNRLYEYTYDLLFTRKINVVFFYLTGRLNPADQLSRNFGVNTKEIVIKAADDMAFHL